MIFDKFTGSESQLHYDRTMLILLMMVLTSPALALSEEIQGIGIQDFPANIETNQGDTVLVMIADEILAVQYPCPNDKERSCKYERFDHVFLNNSLLKANISVEMDYPKKYQLRLDAPESFKLDYVSNKPGEGSYRILNYQGSAIFTYKEKHGDPKYIGYDKAGLRKHLKSLEGLRKADACEIMLPLRASMRVFDAMAASLDSAYERYESEFARSRKKSGLVEIFERRSKQVGVIFQIKKNLYEELLEFSKRNDIDCEYPE